MLLSNLTKLVGGTYSGDDVEISDINTLENKIKFLKNKRKELEKILDVHKYSVVEDIEKIYKELGYTVYKKILNCEYFKKIIENFEKPIS